MTGITSQILLFTVLAFISDYAKAGKDGEFVILLKLNLISIRIDCYEWSVPKMNLFKNGTTIIYLTLFNRYI